MEQAERVAVFGVDGVRFDALRRASTPHIDAIARRGFLAPVAVWPHAESSSGPGWSTIATGVFPDVHGVVDNDLTPNRFADHPDFLSRAQRLGLTTYAAATWPPLLTKAGGGPVFNAGTTFFADPEADGGDEFDRADAAVVADAAATLGGTDVHCAFVYQISPDSVAHYHGTGAGYRTAIERADARVGEVLAAIEAREGFRRERWTCLVVTDHGHVDAGGHGGTSPEECTAWLAGCGPAIEAGRRGEAVHTEVSGLVMAGLGRVGGSGEERER